MASAPGTDRRKLIRVRITLSQMLHDRGYIIPVEDYQPKSPDEAERRWEGFNRGTLLMFTRANEEDRIMVFFAEQGKLGLKDIKGYVEQMEKEKVRRSILITQSGSQCGITPYAKKLLEEAQSQYGYIIERFEENELLINVTHHVLVPKHELLTLEAKQELLEKYHLQETQLPRIQMADPVARYYGLKRSDVVKITRPSETAGTYVTYRLVV